MSKQIWRRLLKAPPVVLGLNVFILASLIENNEIIQKLYFVFGIIALYLLSLFNKPKRILEDWRIGAFVFWALFLTIWHSQIWISSITYRYLNFYLMSEGFIYIFCGILFYKLIYEYADGLPAIWPILAIYIGKAILTRSLTSIFAFIICFLIWCVIKRKWKFLALIVILTGIFISMNLHYTWIRWQTRVFALLYTLKEITQHPLVGTGFDKGLMSNMIVGPRGWTFRHNDFLNITKDLGLPALVLIIVFIKDFIKRFKFDLLDVLCLGTLIIGFFRTSWYWPNFAVVGISLLALWRIKCQAIIS